VIVNGNWGVGVAVGDSGVGVSVGGCGSGVLLGGGGGGAVVGNSGSSVAASGVWVDVGVSVSVGGIGVDVGVDVGSRVGVKYGVKVNVGRGVFVGTGVAVGICTSSLPTEQLKLPARTITSHKLVKVFCLINTFSILLSAVARLLPARPTNSLPRHLGRRGSSPKIYNGRRS